MKRYTCELRSSAESGQIRGYASVFNQVAQIGHSFEQIDPSAFDRALREQQDVVLLLNHDGAPIARTGNGSLKLSTDEYGLVFETTELPDTQLARDTRELVARGLLSKCSFGFVPTAEEYRDVEGVKVRTITDLTLYDTSLVTFPAYDGTEVALRDRASLHKISRQRRASGQAALIRARNLLKEEI